MADPGRTAGGRNGHRPGRGAALADRHWLDDALSRSSEADVAAAWAHRDTLVAWARLVHELAGHDPDLGSCDAAGCGLAALPDGSDLCSLTDRLARLTQLARPVAPSPDDLAAGPPAGGAGDARTEGADLTDAVASLRAALPAAVDAVRECRRTQHPDLRCWFAEVPGIDGCAEVLRAAHRCG